MSYRMLALDLDGTLTNARKEITPRTRKALLRVQEEKGIQLILCSGRPPMSIWPLARQLQLPEHRGFIISYNGGKIIDCSSGQTLYDHPLTREQIQAVYRFIQGSTAQIMAYLSDCIITEAENNEYVEHGAFINKVPIQVVPCFMDAFDVPLNKCLVVDEPERLAAMEARMKRDLGLPLSIFRSMPFFLEVVPEHVDKALALEFLMKHTESDRGQLIACGDGWNDLSMLHYAGLGVAMQNAQEIVKEQADYVTQRSNEEDGIAEVVEKFLL